LEKNAMIIDEGDRGHTVTVKVGSPITVRLGENPTTGYRWALVDHGDLEVASDTFEQTGDAIGAAGVRIFTFHAPQQGRSRLRFKNWREWEGERSVIQQFEVMVEVQ
jgi:inhibitor of cysteine peptidase